MKREYHRNWYCNMTDEEKQKVKDYYKRHCEAKKKYKRDKYRNISHEKKTKIKR